MKNISILGCGWLGLPLAENLISLDYTVKGSTTRVEKIEKINAINAEAYLIDLEPDFKSDVLKEFLHSEIVFIDFPPKLKMNEPDFYLSQVNSILRNIDPEIVKRIMFISSTSIYPLANKEMFEEDADPENVFFKAEKSVIDFCKENDLTCSIFRSAGLMGYDRIPCKYFSGWQKLSTGDIPVNYIHRDDIINIIIQSLETDLNGTVYNLVCPKKPLRKDVYKQCCKETGIEMPDFVVSPNKQDFKIINGDKIIDELNYKFKYPSPLDFPYE